MIFYLSILTFSPRQAFPFPSQASALEPAQPSEAGTQSYVLCPLRCKGNVCEIICQKEISLRHVNINEAHFVKCS